MTDTKYIELFWKDAKTFALKYLEIWEEINIDNVYNYRHRCNMDECWYKNDSNRLNNLELYKFNGFIICDVCWSNGCAEVLFSDKALKNKDIIEINLDKLKLDEEIIKQINQLEVGDSCENCGTTFYKEEFETEYWKACSVCKCGLYNEYSEIDNKHIEEFSGYYEILLCDCCIMHEGGMGQQ